MEIETPKMSTSQQDMDLIDILWRQDIDLGARREVFDYSHRQKERELQRQLEAEEAKRQELARQQEKALLAQLQLDEETGEFVPRAAAAPAAADEPSEITQDVGFTEDNGDAMSFDECMQLLAETFPLVENSEPTPAGPDAALAPAPASGHTMMAPEQPHVARTPAHPDPLPPQRTSPDLEQAWMELLSLPELQCLNMQMEDTLLDTSGYLPTSSPQSHSPAYSFYPLPQHTDDSSGAAHACPRDFVHSFEGAFPTGAPPDHLGQMTLEAPEINATFSTDVFCDVFYPDLEVPGEMSSAAQVHGQAEGDGALAGHARKPPFKPMDAQSLSPGEMFDRGEVEVVTECPDSDSGVSFNTSPNASSPEKSVYGDGSYGFSDSDMEEMDSNPGSAESDYSEMFSLNYQPDGFKQPLLASDPAAQKRVKKHRPNKTEPDEETGHSSHPFTKDKPKKRSEKRLSRDEQKAKALQIPFTVDTVINLPVDDFNEMMSKHQLNEAQLALVRDIRRRGKNKVAAQNCRKRKMDNIVGLEYDLDSLKEEKERQLEEKRLNAGSLREAKRQLSTLYLEVFSLLRDEEGRSYSPADYSLQQTTDGSVFLVPRVKKTLKSGPN
ncbi:nuclear factor erythroid 2-related factor 2a isoform X1 [Hypomesus transpacificus]|uniref:nuclear factor erythroid 2-related factor 2a isoform X1 n=1 Tax=Hypomesus transpacificus TaxID=137520 RepID=UPI001F07E5BC|nr:nuclear factor erythroid 2-related factor 2a isoform X1 [Hypomesus transpacificus]